MRSPAISIANDSKYGLHAAVIGTDLHRARCVASQLRAGRVVINGEAFLETRAILEA
jgi:aldehyde dehydrogenase (NAD+)